MADTRDAEMEIFETDDVEEEALAPSQNAAEDFVSPQGDQVDTVSVAPSHAFEVFAGKAYATAAADFSDALSLSTRAKELSIVAKHSGTPAEPETPLQRLLRLQHEAKELALEVGAASEQAEPEAFPTSLASEVAALSKQLEAMSIPAALGSTFDPEDQAAKALRVQADLSKRMLKAAGAPAAPATADGSGAVYELFVTPDAPAGVHAATLKSAELEQRLAVLEASLGIEGTAGVVGSSSLVEKVERLENKVDLLDATKLESVGRKAATLATHLSALLKQKRQVAPNSEQEQKIEQLYQAVERWDSVAQAVPSVVTRLHALKDLQDSSLTLKATVSKMESNHAQLTQQIRTQTGQIESVEKSFGENAQQITVNVTNLEQRMEALSKKMEQIK